MSEMIKLTLEMECLREDIARVTERQIDGKLCTVVMDVYGTEIIVKESKVEVLAMLKGDLTIETGLDSVNHYSV